MRLVSWNVAGRVTRLAEQVEGVLALDADLVCLQELTRATLPRWECHLEEAGYHCLAASADGRRHRQLQVLTAARTPLAAVALAGVPWPERVLAARLEHGLEVVNVHSPTSAKPNLAKVLTHEAVFAHLAERAPRRVRVLCGDLNTPRREHPDGTVWTFARDRYGRLRPERGERWDQAELALIRNLEPFGFRDAYRALHGYDRRELSWEWQRWKGGYRLDHMLVSGPMAAAACEYVHALREAGLSDHSAMLAEISSPRT